MRRLMHTPRLTPFCRNRIGRWDRARLGTETPKRRAGPESALRARATTKDE